MKRNQKTTKKKPLRGKTVLVTRSAKQALSLQDELKHFGARVISLPTIEIAPVRSKKLLDGALHQLHTYDWLVLTSRNGVDIFYSRFKKLKLSTQWLSKLHIAAIGPSTQARLSHFSIRSQMVSKQFTTDSLLSAFKKRNIKGKRFLWLRVDIAPTKLATGLKRMGAKVNDVVAYQTKRPKGLALKVRRVMKREAIDYMTFTSASTATHFFEAHQKKRTDFIAPKVISIGKMTTEAILKMGERVDRQARRSTLDGIVEAVLAEERKTEVSLKVN